MEGCDKSFKGDMDIIKGQHYYPKKIGVAKILMLKVLSSLDLDLQMLFFKLTIKSNVNSTIVLPQKVNPLTQLWTSLVASSMIILKLLEYFQVG